jgi:sterol desaturase/sphingolipid hydroxylase (fatty acid hydroxylase superfamily)
MPATSSTFALLAPKLAVLGVALAFIALEILYARLARLDVHDPRETAASIGVAIGDQIVRVLGAGLAALPMFWAYEFRPFDIALFEATPQAVLGWLALFLGLDFLYYWMHYASHKIRWMWATHSVHHSATRYNFSAAIRLGWTGLISGNFLFFVPLAALGFHPVAIALMLMLNLLYQFFLHTELAPKLGPLEWVLNTPAHHAVHHATNRPCLDKNFGGVLIVFDRLFGTFAEPPRHEAMRYGVIGREPSYNPFRIAFAEWARMLADVRAASGWRERIRALLVVR